MSFKPKTTRWSRSKKKFVPMSTNKLPSAFAVKQIKNVKKSIKKINDKQELKYKDRAVSYQISAVGNFTLLNDVDIGTTPNDRVGDEITVTSLQFRGFLEKTATLQFDTVRVILLWDRQPNGAPPTASTILDDSIITSLVFAPYHRQYQKRYKILYDKTSQINSFVYDTTLSENEVRRYPISFKRKKLGRMIKYDGTAAGIADIQTNSLYLFTMCTSGGGMFFEGGFRLYFKDD